MHFKILVLTEQKIKGSFIINHGKSNHGKPNFFQDARQRDSFLSPGTKKLSIDKNVYELKIDSFSNRMKSFLQPYKCSCPGILKVWTEKYENILSNHDHGKSLIDGLQNDSFEFLTFVDITF